MSEPTSKLTAYDLIMRIARKAGIAYYGSAGNEKAMVPIDTYNLELCKNIVNDAIRMFISDAPLRGWRWQRRIMSVELSSVRITGTADDVGAASLTDLALATTYDENDDLNGYYLYVLTGTGKGSRAKITDYNGTTGRCDISATTKWLDQYGNTGGTVPAIGDTFAITSVETIGGDITRYPLAEDFRGHVTGRITYAKDSNRGHIIDWAGESEIRTRREVNVISGHPNRAAVRPYGLRRWELIVDPSPTSADTVIFPYELGFDALQIEAGDINTGASDALTDDSLGAFWPNDYFNGWTIYIMAGTGRGSRAEVYDYTGASGKFDLVDDKWLAADGTTTGTSPDSEAVYYVDPINNKHPAGIQFDEVILSACLAKTEMEFEDVNLGFMSKYLQKDLPAAHAIDMRSAPRKLGIMRSGTGRYMGGRIREDITNWSRTATTGLWDVSRDV